MTDWGEYPAAWAPFMLTHTLPLRPVVKPRLVARMGRTGFALAYSALSLMMLAWLVAATGRAPQVVLWPMPEVAHWIVLAAMLLLALSLGRPNPFSFGSAQDHRFDPDRP